MSNQTSVSTRYSMPFFMALGLHIIVLTFLLVEISLPVRSTSSASSSTNIIHAVAVSQKAIDQYEHNQYEQAVNASKQAQLKLQQQQQAALLKQQQEQLKQQQIQQQQAQLKLQQQQQAAAQQAAAQKAAAAQAAQQAAQKLAAQKLAQAQAVAASTKAQQQIQKKKLQQALAKDMQSELNSDQTEINKNASTIQQQNQQSQQNLGMINKYKALIIQAISQQWIVPSNLSNDISCVLDIRLAPGGVVLQVSVATSSGNPLLDNSAIAAVNKASPLPVPADPSEFDQFRELHLTVKPDGSMTSS